ncbi:MAG: hypothetical protein Q8N90_04360 [bacterium]|nr:hypothetical protein [bacterium]
MILKSLRKSFWQRLKKGLLRMGKGILDVVFQMALVAGVLIGMCVVLPFLGVIWVIVSSVFWVLAVLVFGLKVGFFCAALIPFLATIIIFYLVARKRGIWKKFPRSPSLFHY